jgi:hypothetical protein
MTTGRERDQAQHVVGFRRAQTLEGAHRGRICVRVFIEVTMRVL